MCGIAGFVAPGRWRAEQLEPLVRDMVRPIRHRGPDDDGEWTDAGAGVSLGHCRLAVLDPTPAGHQPMASSDARFVCSFNGEIYNAPELRAELISTGIRFRSHTDTEVLLEAVARWGVRRALERMTGMFAVALWDRQRRELSLARDRFGEKPLYYAHSRHALVFASELRSLRRYPGLTDDIDRGAVADVLEYGYVGPGRTIYANVHQLAPGSYLTWSDDGAIAVDQYWSPEEIARQASRRPFIGTPVEAVDELDTLLRSSVRQRLLSDVPLGAFLSGGIDSSIISAIANDLVGGGLRTFTVGFTDPSYDESGFAREVAEHLGTQHVERFVGHGDVVEVVPDLAEMFDEPFADSSQIPVHLVARVARQDVTVALAGDGGDELFAGYDRYGIESLFPSSPLLRRLSRAAVEGFPAARIGSVLSTLDPVLPASVRVVRPEDKLRKLRQVLRAGSIDEAYLSTLTLGGPGRRLVVGGENGAAERPFLAPPELTPTVRFSLHDVRSYLPNDLLVKTDRATMAVSLETRVPMLDPDIAAFAWRLPVEMKRRRGVGKWVLRELARRYLPNPIVDRPKMGFGVPIGEWLRGPIRPWAEDVMRSPSLLHNDILYREPVELLWRDHLSGRVDHGAAMWAALSLLAWHGRYVGRRREQ